MSKKNITAKEKVGTKLHVTFDVAHGESETRTYVYNIKAAKSILKGADPAKYKGKLLQD